MRLRIVALLLVVGCSPPERGEERLRGEGPVRNDGTVIDRGLPDAGGIDRGSPDAGADALPSAPEAKPNPQPTFDAVAAAKAFKFGVCHAPAPTCPSGCATLPAWMLDEANHCVKPVVLVCVPLTSWQTTDLACLKRLEDGLIVRTSGSARKLLGAEWISCTDEDWAKWSDTKCS
jgi:hypothetical protein